MTYAYLGFIEMLQNLFQTIFEKVLTPVLTEILTIFVNYVTNIIWNLWSEVLISLFTMLCSLLDFIESIFNVFAGIAPVLVDGHTVSLLDAVFQMEAVSTVFSYVTVMAVAVCFIFTIYKTAKSISDMTLEDRNPVSKVLGDGLKAAITFLMIPFLCIMMLRLTTVVSQQAVAAFDTAQGGRASVGTVLFLTAGIDADKSTTKEKDLTTGVIVFTDSNRNPSFDDNGVREAYMTGASDYRNLKHVRRDFHIANFNYLVGFIAGIMLFLVMTGSILIFVRRVFELLLLYIVSPMYVSTIPLDDGAVFAKWRELFIAKFFSGFGAVFAMRYYLLLVPAITSSQLVLYDMSLPNAPMINNVLRIFFVVGGAWAVYKSQALILDILSPTAGMAEKQSAAVLTGMIMSGASMAATAATGGAAAAGKMAAGAAAGATAGGVAGGDGTGINPMMMNGGAAKSTNNDENQAYRG